MAKPTLLYAALILVFVLGSSASAIVTSDEMGSHVTTPGYPAFDVNVDGVALITAGLPEWEWLDLLPICSGALISDRYILTAAHCFDADEDGAIDAEFIFPHVAAFELPEQTVMLSINSGEDGWGPLVVHLPDEWPDDDIDLAVIELPEDAPAEIPRYPLYGGTNELGRRFVLVGYGTAGYGATGQDYSFDNGPTKRAGLNRYEDESGTELAYDFDSGLEENNALAFLGFESDLGFGDDEVLLGGGDSGAPNLIHGAIAGVSSYTWRTPFTDVTEERDRSWGEFGFDLRVSSFRDFILDATGNTALFVPDGDFDQDGILAASDIDLLSAKTSDTVYEEGFDLDLDQLVDNGDRHIWVEDLAGTFFGDVDLNQAVEFADFLTLSNNFGMGGGWAEGDFDGDGQTAFSDFLILADNFGKTPGDVAAVPEPNGCVLVWFGLLGIVAIRQRQRR